jgi:hypothetical protein
MLGSDATSRRALSFPDVVELVLAHGALGIANRTPKRRKNGNVDQRPRWLLCLAGLCRSKMFRRGYHPHLVARTASLDLPRRRSRHDVGLHGATPSYAAPTALRYPQCRVNVAISKGADMNANTSERISACLADWSILVIGKVTPPRDPNDDGDDEDEEEDDDAQSDEDEPAVIREPDE